MDNIPHTSENAYRLMREDDDWTKDALVDYIIDLEKIVHEWWEEKQKEYVKAVRCKDCIHRPIKPDYFEDSFDLEFPDDICPCQREDSFYSLYPKDDWFCADGERKTERSKT